MTHGVHERFAELKSAAGEFESEGSIGEYPGPFLHVRPGQAVEGVKFQCGIFSQGRAIDLYI